MAAIVDPNTDPTTIDDVESAPKDSEEPEAHKRGSARFTVSPDDKQFAPGEVPLSADRDPEERTDYADLDPEVYQRLRPVGKSIARILDQAMYPEPEEGTWCCTNCLTSTYYFHVLTPCLFVLLVLVVVGASF